MNIKGLVSAPLLAIQKLNGRIRLSEHSKLVENAPKSAFPPEWHDLWYLYRTVRETEPRVVLEFGSGCSTPIIAAALERNGAGKIYSIEAFAEWADVTRRYFPTWLARRCEIIHSAAVESVHDGTPVWRHDTVPHVVPDLIYLDGPPLSKERFAAVDVLDLEPTLRPGCVLVIDGRKANFAYLRKHLRRKWSFEWHHVAYRGIAHLQA